ncbi:ATP-binding cassette domain-containing protein [Leucobacter denitrificans]|uniref:ABC transporter ATP-binding protein n=1 Tax=Leucobacter denitrificans TaxID=683042 RepID=A0A7G9S314_9MICO|nr:ATP-binding cassette domain-containing protein [Leucobacter denitrificans]QNN62239.1 ABC transporter ATP-binding protein [Leucobacter denitrificans]
MSTALEVKNLNKIFSSGALFAKKSSVHAVNDVSFTVTEGSTMGLIGESGSGKSTTARMVCRLLTPTSGNIELFGRDIVKLRSRAATQVTREVQIVFQDPGSSLNPRWRIGSLVAEGMLTHGIGTAEQRKRRVRELLEMCGLPASAADKFPHEFSGGQRQRIAIARALAVEPRLLILDEPVSALDVSIQAQILILLRDLQRELGMTYLMVSHDLAVVEQFCDDVCVMRNGQIVEQGNATAVLTNPSAEYTQELINAHPEPDPRKSRLRVENER